MNYNIWSAVDKDLNQLLELVKRLGDLELLPQRDTSLFWEIDARQRDQPLLAPVRGER